MKIKIEKILKTLDNRVINKKDGSGTYTIYSWEIGYYWNNQKCNKVLKSFSEKSKEVVKNGAEIEVNEETNSYTGQHELTLILLKFQNNFAGKTGGYQRIEKLKWTDFEAGILACWKLATSIDDPNAPQLFEKIIGVASVVLDFKSLSNSEKLKDTFEGEQLITGFKTGDMDSDVPF